MEAEAVGLPSLAAAQQKLAAAEKVLAQKEELERREAGRREEQDKARREAEAELRAAMPGILTSAEPHRLQAAVEAAKLAGVSPAEIRAAEAKLGALWTKEAIAEEKARLAAEAAETAKLAHYEKELKAAAGLGGWAGFGSQEVSDVLRLEAAIEAARGAGITSEVLGRAEAKLAAIRIDAEKQRSFELEHPDAAAQELKKSFERQNASRGASFGSQTSQVRIRVGARARARARIRVRARARARASVSVRVGTRVSRARRARLALALTLTLPLPLPLPLTLTRTRSSPSRGMACRRCGGGGQAPWGAPRGGGARYPRCRRPTPSRGVLRPRRPSAPRRPRW